jgi:tetratricopeptide (TPR) repeat protein
LFGLKKFNEAIESVDMAIKLNENNGEYYRSKGDIFMEMNNIREAILCYEKAMELEPSDNSFKKLRMEAIEKQLSSSKQKII